MSHIFNEQNQMIIRFPQEIADKLNEYFENGGNQPEIMIQTDSKRPDEQPRIALNVYVDGQQHKASVMQLPSISSSFKTIDRVNFFKSNDISEMIVVHEDSQGYVVNEADAQKIYGQNGERVKKYVAQSGLTEPTKNIRQRFFRKKPNIDRKLVKQVDSALEKIKQDFTNQNKNQDKSKKKKNQSFDS